MLLQDTLARLSMPPSSPNGTSSPYRDSSDDGEEYEKTPMIEDGGVVASKGKLTIPLVGAGILLLASLAANAVLLVLLVRRDHLDLDAIIVNRTSEYWSPVMDGMKIKYESVRFDGSFINNSIYLQDPGPEVDEAWSGLGIDLRTALVPEERGADAGIDPSAVKVRASQGGGYLTNIEVLHHLHCLNMIRQTLPWNVDYYRDSGTGVYLNSEPIVRLHVDHCMDIVRQQLMCSSDVGMFGQRWIQREGKELNVFPIFDTVHKCRNFDDILDWAKRNQAPDEAKAELRDTDVVLDAYT